MLLRGGRAARHSDARQGRPAGSRPRPTCAGRISAAIAADEVDPLSPGIHFLGRVKSMSCRGPVGKCLQVRIWGRGGGREQPVCRGHCEQGTLSGRKRSNPSRRGVLLRKAKLQRRCARDPAARPLKGALAQGNALASGHPQDAPSPLSSKNSASGPPGSDMRPGIVFPADCSGRCRRPC
jgi:hypothetical protein